MQEKIRNLLLRLADGRWMMRERVIRCAGVLLIVELALFVFLVAGTNGLIVRLARPVSVDFVSFYAAGKLAASGAPAAAYDRAAHYAAEQQATEPGISYQYFFYPPVFLLLCRALAALPYLLGFLVFQVATAALFLLSVRSVLGEPGPDWVLPVLAAPAGFWTLGLGQNSFLTAALFGGATALLERRPILAGLMFGALCYKPHFGVLVPLALVAGGHWRVLSGAVLSVSVLCSVSLLWFDWETWKDYLTAFGGSPELFAAGLAAKLSGLVTPFGALRLLGVTDPAARDVQAGVALLAALLVTWVWRSKASLPIRAATLISATLIAVPVALVYDLLLSVVAIAWLIRARRTNASLPGEKAVLAAAFLIPLLQIQASELTHVSPAPFVTAALLAVSIVRARRENRAADSIRNSAADQADRVLTHWG